MRSVTRGSSPAFGVKALFRLEEDETRGNFVLRTLNAFFGAGGIMVVAGHLIAEG